MSATQPPSDAPFGLDPNLAAGLAYLLTWIGGIIFLVGGGTNRFVKFAAAQSLTFWILWIIAYWVLGFLSVLSHGLLFLLFPVLGLIGLGVWLWTMISAFQGKEVKLPFVSSIVESLFKSQLG
jgi:uncharacterized membrane protein